MAQVTSGIRSVLSSPVAYRTLQSLLGAVSFRTALTREYLRPQPGTTVIDIGCGTGELFPHMPAGVNYLGFDLSPEYIRKAKEREGGADRFFCADVAELDASKLPPCELVIAIGLLHHLDDERASKLMLTAHEKLRPGGRLVTLDCALVQGQSRIARKIILADRGQNVRTPEAYAALAAPHFGSVATHVRHDMLRIPYTHCILECTK